MDRLIQVRVNGNHLAKDSKRAGAQYEANATKLRITFDESWNSCAKTVTWWNAKGNNPVKIVLTTALLEDAAASTLVYLCPIPGEAMEEAGWCTFVIDGYIEGKRTRSVGDELEVEFAPYGEEAGEPADPTPSQAEQLQAGIEALQTIIHEAGIETIHDTILRAEQSAAAAEAAANRAEQVDLQVEEVEKNVKQVKGYANDAYNYMNQAKESANAVNTHNSSSTAHQDIRTKAKNAAYAAAEAKSLAESKATTQTFAATVDGGWAEEGGCFYQDITVTGMRETDEPFPDIEPSTDNEATLLYADAFSKVFRITTGENSIRVWATEAISISFPIRLKVVR